MAEVIWSPSSLEDIDAIAEYISKDSFQAANTQVDLILEKEPYWQSIHPRESQTLN